MPFRNMFSVPQYAIRIGARCYERAIMNYSRRINRQHGEWNMINTLSPRRWGSEKKHTPAIINNSILWAWAPICYCYGLHVRIVFGIFYIYYTL